MDYSALAKTAASALAAIFKKHPAVEKFQSDFIQAVVDWIRPVFLKDDTPLQDLKKDPDVTVNQNDVATKIEKHLVNNPDGAATLQELLKRLAESGEIPTGGNSATITGDNNSVFQGINGSSISINK